MTPSRTVVFFGTYDADNHPRIRVLMEGLVARGVRVIEVNVPLAVPTERRIELLRRPWLVPWFGARLLRNWIRLWRMAKQTEVADVVVVGYLGHLDVHLAHRLFRAPIVLDHLVGLADTAGDRDLAGRKWRRRLLRTIDRRALDRADLVLHDTTEQLEAAAELSSTPGVVVPVGAADRWFESCAARRPGPLRVVFFGLYTPLQGAPHIGAAIAALDDRDDIAFTMIGHGQDLAQTRSAAGANANVEWIDWVDAADLPAVVACHDVCLGIFGTGTKAARVVPNKVYQGAAAGCAVVTSDSVPQRRAFDGAVDFVPPGKPAALAARLAELASDRDELARRQAEAGRTAAERYRPDRVVDALLGPLESLVDG